MRQEIRKIAILGYSGSGKSTLAEKLAKANDRPLLHLDTIYFTKNWQVRDYEEQVKLLETFLSNSEWVLDGNYASLLQKERLEQADQILLVLFSRWVCLKRVVQRYFKYRGRTRPSMAEGSEEKLDLAFIWWVLHQGRNAQKRQDFQDILDTYGDKVIVLKNQKQVDAYFLQVTNS